MYKSTPINPSGPNRGIQPIASLTPYLGNNWAIKARVTDKGPIRTWNKPKSSGKLISFTLIDESSSIRATMFNGAVDKFNDMLVPNQVYIFSSGYIKNANKKFNNVNNHYEVTFDENSSVEICRDATNMIPHQRYNFVPIFVLNRREPNSLCDVLGVVLQVQEISKIVQKSTGEELIKRNIVLGDRSASVNVTIWKDEALNFNYPPGSVVAIRNVRIGTFDGCSLSTTTQSSFDLNPNVPDTAVLSNWYQTTQGRDIESISKRETDGEGMSYKGRKFFEDIEAEGLGKGEKPDYIDLRCIPSFVRADQIHYEACPSCNKKVSTDPLKPNLFRCERCAQEISHPEYRYMCSVIVSDNVASKWVTLFNEAGLHFFGMSAQELVSKGQKFINDYVADRLYQPIVVRLRVKEEKQGEDAEDQLRLSAIKLAFVGHEMGDPKMAAQCTYKNEINELVQHLDRFTE